MRFLISAALFSFVPLIAFAAPEMVEYSSGSGFFIGRDGDVLTSNHVIEHCAADSMTLMGAVREAPARLVASNKEYDLALLKTNALSAESASLASLKQPMQAGDPVVVVGFPSMSWQSGQVETRGASIVGIMGDGGKWLAFSDAVAKGNSGGPLLDSSGNVVGVVTAKGQLFAHEDGKQDELVSKFDLAVSLPVVKAFLDNEGVRYREADSGIYLSADRITDAARRFVVNVKCRVK